MNNLTTNSSSHDIFQVILGFYIQTVMTYCGAGLNFVCALIFIKIIKDEKRTATTARRSNLFKYLLVKSLIDCLFCVQNMPQVFYYRQDFTINESYGMQFWYLYCFYYLYPVMSTVSVWIEIAASVDCLFLVVTPTATFQWFTTKKCFWLVTIIIITSNSIIYIPNLFWFSIEPKSDGGYYPKVTKFTASSFVHYHKIYHTLIRDTLPVFISMILDSIMFYYIRKSTIRRRAMTKTTQQQQRPMTIVRRSEMAERNKIKMMLITSFVHFFHLPVIIYNFNIFNVRHYSFWAQLCILSINLSYFIPIFLYTTFNSIFKRYFYKIFFCFKWCGDGRERRVTSTIIY
jgi:hypothetical protein